MNPLQIILSAILVVSLASFAQADSSAQPKMYQEKSGVVRSVITQGFSKDKLSTITETFYWDDWGMKIAKYQIKDKDKQGTKTVIRLKVDAKQANQIVADEVALVQLPSGDHKAVPYSAVDVMNTFSSAEKQDMATAFVRKFGQFIETDEQKSVAGQTCTLWRSKTNNGHTNCMWQGIILETTMSTPKSTFLSEKKAVEVKVQAIDPQHFDIPGRIEP